MTSHADMVGTLMLTTTLGKMVHMKLMDKTDLRSLCRYWGRINGTGAVTTQEPMWDASEPFTSFTDGSTTLTATALDLDSFDITVGLHGFCRQLTRLTQITKPGAGWPDLQVLRDQFVEQARARCTDVITGTFSGFTATVGTSGAAFTLQTIIDGMLKLNEAKCGPQRAAVISLIQLSDLLIDIISVGTGDMPWQPVGQNELADVIKVKGPGYQGTIAGTPLWACDSVVEDGDDHVGAMWEIDGIKWKDADMSDALPLTTNATVVPMEQGSNMLFELEPLPRQQAANMVGNIAFGAAIGEDARGTQLIGRNTRT